MACHSFMHLTSDFYLIDNRAPTLIYRAEVLTMIAINRESNRTLLLVAKSVDVFSKFLDDPLRHRSWPIL